MGYNETLQGNNARLQELLAKVNALPEAGGTAEPVLQSKIVSPATSEQVVTPDEGYDGLSDVTVEAVALQNKTVTPFANEQTVTPDSGYDGLEQVTVEAMPTAEQATPSIEVDSSGLIIASATQSAGYVASGTKSAMKQLTTQGAQTITPGTSDQTIASGRYLTGTQTIKGDSNLIPANIVSGVSIFGVQGSAEVGSGGDTCPYAVTVNSNVDAVWYYIWNEEHGWITIVLEPYNGVLATVNSFTVRGMHGYPGIASHGLYQIVSYRYPNGDIELTVVYNMNSGEPGA